VTRSHVNTEIGLRSYRDEDEIEVLQLLSASLGPGPGGERSREFFAWKHLDNPFGPSFMLVAESAGRIVGLRTFMRWGFSLDGRSVRGVRAVDTATHPEFQGRGIFSLLTRTALDSLKDEADIVFNTPNDKSRPGYLKMGWSVAGKLPVAIKLCHPIRVVRSARSLRSGEPATAKPTVDAVTAAEALEDDGTVLELLRGTQRPARRLVTAHTISTLRWRYANAPLLDYRAVAEPGGVAIFRVRPRGPLWEAAVSDVLTVDGGARTVARLLKRVAGSADVDHLTCMMAAGSPGLKAARRRGFIRSPISMELTVRSLNDLEIDPMKLDSWALTLGDVEVF